MEQLSLFEPGGRTPVLVKALALPHPQYRTTRAEIRAVQSAGETLRAAGWRRAPGDALGLTWRIDDPEAPSEKYEVEFQDLAELDQAAALLTATPGLTPAALLAALSAEEAS